MQQIKIEGYTIDELSALINANALDTIIFTNKPVVFNAGSSEILAQFHKEVNEMHIDLSHIDGGGEGILISIKSLSKKYALRNNIETIHWYVHATNCAKPNPKLLRILKLKKYEIKTFEGRGKVYYKKENLRRL